MRFRWCRLVSVRCAVCAHGPGPSAHCSLLTAQRPLCPRLFLAVLWAADPISSPALEGSATLAHHPDTAAAPRDGVTKSGMTICRRHRQHRAGQRRDLSEMIRSGAALTRTRPTPPSGARGDGARAIGPRQPLRPAACLFRAGGPLPGERSLLLAGLRGSAAGAGIKDAAGSHHRCPSCGCSLFPSSSSPPSVAAVAVAAALPSFPPPTARLITKPAAMAAVLDAGLRGHLAARAARGHRRRAASQRHGGSVAVAALDALDGISMTLFSPTLARNVEKPPNSRVGASAAAPDSANQRARRLLGAGRRPRRCSAFLARFCCSLPQHASPTPPFVSHRSPLSSVFCLSISPAAASSRARPVLLLSAAVFSPGFPPARRLSPPSAAARSLPENNALAARLLELLCPPLESPRLPNTNLLVDACSASAP